MKFNEVSDNATYYEIITKLLITYLLLTYYVLDSLITFCLKGEICV